MLSINLLTTMRGFMRAGSAAICIKRAFLMESDITRRRPYKQQSGADVSGYRIRSLKAAEFESVSEALTDLLIDCVNGGASVSFMLPLERDKATAFWLVIGKSVARGERTVIVAEDEQGKIVGTVQLITSQPENQPHRADVAKLLVHSSARRKGIARRLMAYLEAVATTQEKSVLVLDTATGSAAEILYQNMGWLKVGDLPFYALMPDGSPCSTTFYYRQL